jgi:hypothetical protein
MYKYSANACCRYEGKEASGLRRNEEETIIADEIAKQHLVSIFQFRMSCTISCIFCRSQNFISVASYLIT